jgi:hypothetical protein
MVIACVPLAACDSSRGNSGPVPIDRLVDELTSAQCELLVRCHFVSDQAFCRGWIGLFDMKDRFNSLGAIVGRVHAGTIHYDDVAASACLDAVRSGACEEVSGSTAISAPCDKVFAGSIADGGQCVADVECSAGSFCSRPGAQGVQACSGTCMTGGIRCNTDSQCGSGQVCDLAAYTETTNGSCATPTPPGAANQACGTNHRCQPGLYCTTSSGTPTCVPLGQAGQPCEFSGVGGCAPGLICAFDDQGQSATCMAPAAKGQPCQVRAQCGAPLFSSIVCDEVQHVCVDAPTSGPCVGTGFTSCNFLSAYCDLSQPTPTCKPYAAIGASCMTDHECGVSGARCGKADPASPVGSCQEPSSCMP